MALLPIASKVMESLIDDHIRLYIDKQTVLAPQEHGFRPGHSCTTNLLTAMEDWTQAVDHNTPVDVVYLDFSKAFDRVNHKVLLRKLSEMGIGGNLHRWLTDYLSGRSYQVRVNRTCLLHYMPPAGYHRVPFWGLFCFYYL